MRSLVALKSDNAQMCDSNVHLVSFLVLQKHPYHMLKSMPTTDNINNKIPAPFNCCYQIVLLEINGKNLEV